MMSADLVACPHCGVNLQNTPAIAGQVVACPSCQTQLQMPPLSTTSAVSLPEPITEPAPELPQPFAPSPAPGVGGAVTVAVDASGGRKGSAPKAMDRVRRKSNPLLPVAVIVGVIVLISVGVFGFLIDAARKHREQKRQQLVGNWELVSGQTGHDRGEFAFHSDGKFQVLLQAGEKGEVLDGRWRVYKSSGDTAQVLIDWLDGSGETMSVRLTGGQLRINLPSVGNLTFRAAGPQTQL